MGVHVFLQLFLNVLTHFLSPTSSISSLLLGVNLFFFLYLLSFNTRFRFPYQECNIDELSRRLRIFHLEMNDNSNESDDRPPLSSLSVCFGPLRRAQTQTIETHKLDRTQTQNHPRKKKFQHSYQTANEHNTDSNTNINTITTAPPANATSSSKLPVGRKKTEGRVGGGGGGGGNDQGGTIKHTRIQEVV